jgi:hypothetical protein
MDASGEVGVPLDPASVVAHVFGRAMSYPMRGRGSTQLTPSPQARSPSKHAHHACSSIECVTLTEKAWRGGGGGDPK